MFLAIIAAVFCLAAATLMYTPKMRTFRFYRPVALLLLFEGIWILFDYIFRQISPDSSFTMIIHYVGLIALGAYFMIRILLESKEKSKSKGGKDGK